MNWYKIERILTKTTFYVFIGSWVCDPCVSEQNGKRRRTSIPASLLLQSPEHHFVKTPSSGRKGAQKRKGPGGPMDEENR